MTYARILGRITVNSLCYAAGGAIYGSVGAKILSTAGHAGYVVLEATRAGAAGCAVVGAGVGTVKGIYKGLPDDSQIKALLTKLFVKKIVDISEDGEEKIHFNKDQFIEMLGEMIVSIGLTAFGGALGHWMLSSIAEMSIEKTVAAMAVGSSTMTAAVLTLGLLCVSCWTPCLIMSALAKRNEPTISITDYPEVLSSASQANRNVDGGDEPQLRFGFGGGGL